MADFDKTPLACPSTVTVRRNPPRRARPTPSATTAPPRKLPFSPPSVHNDPISSFPLQDILSIELPPSAARKPRKLPSSENLKVYLRIRPLTISTNRAGKQHSAGEGKNVWPKNRKPKNAPKSKVRESEGICVAAAKESGSVTVTPPESLPESKRVKKEVYEGFSQVFSDEASQSEVYEKMVHPLVEDFLKGKSGMLAALGPSGSGKTHTVFGSVRDPGMVPLALRHIFSRDEGSDCLKGSFSLSMFEICSEKGKSERLFDLLREGSEVHIQQSGIKGLDEVVINDVQQAESLIACGMLRRATASTNSNSQSSRSQCIINICYYLQKGNEELDDEQEKALFTIVDLAGAEREKKTGNQGLRMVESNFINNTSMLFGLCLRSLLEHQKNQRKPLQKHFQNSLLTRYLRDYLEGKKRMALILTVKPGEDDYPETSNLLKQAAPFAKIKFANTEETGNQKCAKRPMQNFLKVDNGKRMKFSTSEKTNVATGTHGDQPQKQTKEFDGIVKDDKGVKLKELVAEGEDPISSKVNDGSNINVDPIDLARREREHLIMVNFSRALWAVLKEYKGKLEIAQNEICCLKDDLTCEKKRSSQLENQLKDLKSTSSSGDEESAEVGISSASAACSTDSSEEQHKKKHENSRVPESLAEKNGEFKDLQVVNIYLDNGATVSIASQIDASNRFEDAGIDNTRPEIGRTGCLESVTCVSESFVHTRDAGFSSEEKESTISDATILDSAICSPSTEKESATSDADVLNYAVCSPSVKDKSALSVFDVIVPESIACSPSAEMESTISVDTNPDSPAWFPSAERESTISEVTVPDPAACSLCAEKESSIPDVILPGSPNSFLSTEKKSAICYVIAPHSDACSPSAEKEVSMSDVILSDSATCILLTEKESAVSYVTVPHSVACSPSAEKNLSVSGVILPNSSTYSLSAEKESAIPDVILLHSAACYPSAEKESTVSDRGDSSSLVKNVQVPHVQAQEEVDSVKTGNDADISHSLPTSSSQNKQKPRRRLQPVSTNLLKNVEHLAATDEIDLPKGFKGGKALGTDTRNKSRGNISLLRLLREDLFR